MLSQVWRKSSAIAIIQHSNLSPSPPFLHSISFIYLIWEHLVSWRLNFIDWPSTWSVPTNVRPLTDCFLALLFSSYLLILWRLSLFSPVKRLTFIKDSVRCNFVIKFCSFYCSQLVSSSIANRSQLRRLSCPVWRTVADRSFNLQLQVGTAPHYVLLCIMLYNDCSYSFYQWAHTMNFLPVRCPEL